ncbi:MAG: hypothetical protein LBJ25_01865 [Candidatus Margulisbacteria bacterium]|nr:hypothetical protein [Candidatus Margulisiibacteriota bacterium]
MANDYTDSFAEEPYFISKGEQLSAAGMTAALNTREKVANKKDTVVNSSTEYPSAKAVYDLNGTVVHKAGAETITGIKTFGTADSAAEPKLGAAKITDAANDGTKFATEAQVYNILQSVDILPIGLILAIAASSWINVSAAFKSKWRVCDGSGGTPNLTGRFLRGGTVSDALIGGADSQVVALETKHMPKHSHAFSGEEARGSYNFVKKDVYEVTGVFSLGIDSGVNYQNVNNLSGAVLNFSMTPKGSISETGGGQAASGYGEAFNVPTVPSYYTVIYIMKVA